MSSLTPNKMLEPLRQRIGGQRRDSKHPEGQHFFSMHRTRLPGEHLNLHMLTSPSQKCLPFPRETPLTPRTMEPKKDHSSQKQRKHKQKDRLLPLQSDPQLGNGKEAKHRKRDRQASPCQPHGAGRHQQAFCLKLVAFLIEKS